MRRRSGGTPRRVLFAVQGEGRGHLSQALAFAEILARAAGEFELVAVVVGSAPGRTTPSYFRRRIGADVCELPSPSLETTPDGRRVSVPRTVTAALRRALPIAGAVRRLRALTEELRVDIVVNFLEPLVGAMHWTGRVRPVTVSVGHQYLFLHPGWQAPPGSLLQRTEVSRYARLAASGSRRRLALSFYEMPPWPSEDLLVTPPLIRRRVLDLDPRDAGFFLVYLLKSAYADEIVAWQSDHPEHRFECFWDRWDLPAEHRVNDNLVFHHLDDTLFLDRLARCRGLVTTAGFESVCEAMYLGKPCLVVPVAGHFEQLGNALDAERTGAACRAESFDVSVLIEFMERARPDDRFRAWVESGPDRFLEVLRELVDER